MSGLRPFAGFWWWRKRKAATPLTIASSKIVGWFKDSYTPGFPTTRVGTRLDLSPNANHLIQGAGGNQPSYTANVIDGKAGITFANAHWLRRDALIGMPAGSRPRVYEVLKLTSLASTDDSPWEMTPGTATNSGITVYCYGANPKPSFARAFAPAQITTPQINLTPQVFKLWDTLLDASALTVSLNNVVAATIGGAGAGLPACNYLTEGAYPDGSASRMDGVSVELLICNPAPTAGEHAALIAYFKARYPSLGL